MSLNPYTKSIETKLYFIVFTLFSSFLTLLIYNASIDTSVTSDSIINNQSRVFRPRTEEELLKAAGLEDMDGKSHW